MLEKVNYPQDIKKLSFAQLQLLAQEIRDLIIKVTAKQGGHLASSLGAVELCIALHYCFNTPEDSLIFDVGHQAYAHKILTGRKDKFPLLRQYQGLSGFPNPQESEYDLFISGHASTAVSWAQGLAEAKKIKNDKSKTVAIIGDGSLTGGMCFEALNNCGHKKSNVLVILNHNQMSIAESVGALSHYLNKIISLPIYNRIKGELENFLNHMPLIAKRLAKKAKKLEEALKSLIVPGVFFEELGFRYFGPFNGNNLSELIPTLERVKSISGPCLLHIITKKGQGLRCAEDNPECFHSAKPFDKESGEFISKNKPSYSEIFARRLTILARENKKIAALTAAMPKGTGLDIFKEKYPQRFFDLGIAEAHTVGFAAGLAKAGLRPVVAIYSTFLQRALDQIIHDVALQGLPVIFAVDRAGLVGADGPTHHGVFDLTYLRMVPGMVVMAPKDKEEFEAMLDFALQINNPIAIRYPKAQAASLGFEEKISLGKGQILQEGKDVCLLAAGSMVEKALHAAKELAQEHIHCGVANARFVKPLDESLLRDLAKRFSLIFTLEENTIKGGFGAAVLEFYTANNLLNKLVVKNLAIPDNFVTFGGRDKLLELCGLGACGIAKTVKEALASHLIWQK